MESTLKRIITFGIYAALATPLIVSSNTFFPFIVGKTIAFRVIVELLFPVWLVWVFSQRRLQMIRIKDWLRQNPLAAAILVYFAVLVLATIFSVNPYRSLWSNAERMEGLFTLLHFLAFFLILSSVFRGAPAQWRRFFRWSLLVSLAVTAAAYIQWFELPWLTAPRGMPEATLGNPSYVSAYLVFHIALAALLAVESSQRPLRFLYAFIIFAESLMVFLLGTRGVFTGIALTLLFAALAAIIWRPLRALRRTALVVLMALLILGGFLWFYRASDFVRSSQELSRAAGVFRFGGDSLRSRLLNWKSALTAWRERPLLGWGPEMNYAVFYTHVDPELFSFNEEVFDRPHNKLVEVLVTTGLLGLSAYLALWGVVGRELVRRIALGGNLAGPFLIGAALSVYGIQNLFIFDHLSSYLIFFLFLGYIEATRGSADAVVAPSRRPWLFGVPAAIVVLFLLVINFRHFQQTRAINDLGLAPLEGGTALFRDMSARPSPFLVESALHFRRVLDRRGDVPVSELLQAVDEGIRASRAAWAQDVYDMRVPLTLSSFYVARFQLTRDPSALAAAREVLGRALSIAPDFLNLYYQLAVIEASEGDLGQAREAVMKALERSPQARRAHWFLGQVELITGNFAAARQEVDTALQLGYRDHHRDPVSLSNLARIYAATGEDTLSAFYATLSRWHSRVRESDIALIAVYRETGQYEAGRALLMRLRQSFAKEVSGDELAQFERDIEVLSAAFPLD